MLVQDPETGEWYDEEEEGARTERMIEDEPRGVNIEPGYRYDFSAEGELRGRVPQDKPEYRPVDPHKDADVVIYPDEIHTKNKEGKWDVAPREKPPGPRPSDTELSAMEKYEEFMPMWMEKRGIDPEAPEKAFDQRKREYLRAVNAGISATSQVLRSPQRAAEIEEKANQQGEIARDKEQARFDREINLGKSLFSLQYTKDEEARRNQRELLEQQTRDKALLAERRIDVEKKAVEKAAADIEKKAEKISEVNKERLKDISQERRDIKSRIKKIGKPFDAEEQLELDGLKADLAEIDARQETILTGKISAPLTKNAPSVQKKLIGRKNGKPVYDLGNGKWQVGD